MTRTIWRSRLNRTVLGRLFGVVLILGGACREPEHPTITRAECLAQGHEWLEASDESGGKRHVCLAGPPADGERLPSMAEAKRDCIARGGAWTTQGDPAAGHFLCVEASASPLG